MSESLNDQQKRRLEELTAFEEAGVNPYPYSYERTHSANDIKSNFNPEKPENFDNVAIAGRIMSIRRMGKASFFHLADQSGKIQIYFKKNDMPEFYELMGNLDIGDFLGVKGHVFVTRTGETSVYAKEAELLCKSLRPLPVAKEEVDEEGNKIVHDAFADKELRYRKRYLDLIVNPEIKKVFVYRSKIITALRNFFDSKGWIEVETPILQPIYGGASARPFVTHHNALDIPLYMRIADELYLKRLIVGGFEGVYEISKNFRNEGMDKTHNPEFTAMEIYVAYKDYNWMMDLTEEMIRIAASTVSDTLQIEYNGVAIDLEKPFERRKMFDLFKEYTGFDLKGKSRDELAEIGKGLGITIEDGWSAMKILDEIFSCRVEKHLVQPTFVIDYPLEMSPLAKKHRTEEGLVERFELFVNGAEMANAFSELNDPRDQRARFEEQSINRAAGDDEAMVLDEDFLQAIEYGMPPTAGLGVGIDRLVMLLTGQTSIRDVLFFPQMRPEKKVVK